MKKQILNLGKVLNKVAQKQINGGDNPTLPMCQCDTTGTIINQPCEGIGPGCGVIDIDVCLFYPSKC
ncbi:hypothetical protein [Tenacibaculum sp.]|uniref:hypothetical protein n=1 Tax=Tenacibaculum sp. TaxID=1906242 RepID=UPI003D0BFA8D